MFCFPINLPVSILKAVFFFQHVIDCSPCRLKLQLFSMSTYIYIYIYICFYHHKLALPFIVLPFQNVVPFRPSNMKFFFLLVGPLSRNPSTDIDKTINKLRLKYRMYTIDHEFDCVGLHVLLFKFSAFDVLFRNFMVVLTTMLMHICRVL